MIVPLCYSGDALLSSSLPLEESKSLPAGTYCERSYLARKSMSQLSFTMLSCTPVKAKKPKWAWDTIFPPVHRRLTSSLRRPCKPLRSVARGKTPRKYQIEVTNVKQDNRDHDNSEIYIARIKHVRASGIPRTYNISGRSSWNSFHSMPETIDENRHFYGVPVISTSTAES